MYCRFVLGEKFKVIFLKDPHVRRSAAGHPLGDTVPVSGDVPHLVWRSGVAHGVSLSETRPKRSRTASQAARAAA